MRTVDIQCEALAERVRECLRRRGLELSAWYLCDDIETLVWYNCREMSVSERLRVTRHAQVAAAASLVPDALTDDEFSALIALLPANLHEIFMRPATPPLQRSW